MSILATATVAALLVASPSLTDAERVAANGGFLLGNAQRCGIDGDRVVEAGQLVRELIAATAEDARAQEEATVRFARFFLVSAVADPKDSKVLASCQKVAREFERFEQYRAVAAAAETASGENGTVPFRLGDGE
jgi:hypothetical protein